MKCTLIRTTWTFGWTKLQLKLKNEIEIFVDINLQRAPGFNLQPNLASGPPAG
jgi:hypothetical protein